jgi:hypothetical protein
MAAPALAACRIGSRQRRRTQSVLDWRWVQEPALRGSPEATCQGNTAPYRCCGILWKLTRYSVQMGTDTVRLRECGLELVGAFGYRREELGLAVLYVAVAEAYNIQLTF